MIPNPEGAPPDERTVEQKYRSAVAGLTARIKNLYTAITHRWGDAGLDMIRETSRAYGVEISARAKGRVKEDDIQSIGAFIIRVFETIGGEGEVVHFSDDRVVIRIFRCPYAFHKPEMCRAHTEMEKALVETLGSNVQYRITCSIPEGDDFCDHVICRPRHNAY